MGRARSEEDAAVKLIREVDSGLTSERLERATVCAEFRVGLDNLSICLYLSSQLINFKVK